MLTTFRLIIIASLLIVLTGCGMFSEQRYEPIEMPEKISVPVYEPCPALEKIDREYLPIHDIDETTPDEDVVRKYYQTVHILKHDNKEYREMIEVCKDFEPSNLGELFP